jgi:hypothetical protein
VTPELDDQLFLSFLYPLARDGWLADDAEERVPDLDDLPMPYWPKQHRFVVDGHRFSGAHPTLTKKAMELEAAYSSYGPNRSEAFSTTRRGRTASSSAPTRHGPSESKDDAEIRAMIYLWFANRDKLRKGLQQLEPEKRRERIRDIRSDPRFIQLREIAAQLEGVAETFQEMIDLQQRSQDRLRRLSKSEKRERLTRLLTRQPELSNGVLAGIFKSSRQTVLSIRRELEEAGLIETFDERRDTLGRRQPTRRHPVLDTSTRSSEAV